jgi:hypothetical protein
MGGIPIIVIVVFLVIWVLTNVLRAQQDDSKAARRPPVGPAHRPPGAPPLERNTASDIDRFLAEIDRLRQRGPQGEEPAPTAARPTQRPAATPPPPPRPVPSPPQARPQPPAARPRTQQPQQRGAQGHAKRPTPPPAPPAKVAAPMPMTEAPAPAAASDPVQTRAEAQSDVRFVETSRQKTLVKLAGVAGAVSPSARKPPSTGSALEAMQTLLKGKSGLACAVLLGEILGEPRCRRRRA